MPPRIPSRPLLNCLEGSTPVVSRTPSIPAPCRGSSLRPASAARSQQQTSCFSTTQSRDVNRIQRRMREWMKTRGENHRVPKPGQTNYLTSAQGQGGSRDKLPFPTNPTFVSQPVLSEAAREAIWTAAMIEGAPIKSISARFSVDIRRVAAVIRMMEIQKRWELEGKPMAWPYARAVMDMLPQTQFDGENAQPHEPVNEIHVHSYTMQQLFVPASESRHFTRADAAKAFGDHILPADERVALPELVQLERSVMEGMSVDDASHQFEQDVAASEQELADRQAAKQEYEEAKMRRVKSDRFEFRVQDINSQAVGPTGRSRTRVGFAYGAPSLDRKRGQVKIPTRVE